MPVKPIHSDDAAQEARKAFELLRTYRTSDSIGVLIDYLHARMAFIQAAAVSVGEADRLKFKHEFEMCSGIVASLNSDDDGPLMIL